VSFHINASLFFMFLFSFCCDLSFEDKKGVSHPGFVGGRVPSMITKRCCLKSFRTSGVFAFFYSSWTLMKDLYSQKVGAGEVTRGKPKADAAYGT
jgi:hypothetical protein